MEVGWRDPEAERRLVDVIRRKVERAFLTLFPLLADGALNYEDEL